MSMFAPLWLAVHESAHAVTQLVMSETYFPGPRIRSVTVKANPSFLLAVTLTH
jgi:hypothetical protein